MASEQLKDSGEAKFEADTNEYAQLERLKAEQASGLNQIDDPVKAEAMAYEGKRLMDDAIEGEESAARLSAQSAELAERAETQSRARQTIDKLFTGHDDKGRAELASYSAEVGANTAERNRGHAELNMEREGRIYDLQQEGFDRDQAEFLAPMDIEGISRVMNKWSKRHLETSLTQAQEKLATSEAALAALEDKGESRLTLGIVKRRKAQEAINLHRQEVELFESALAKFSSPEDDKAA